jgi:protein phosphatase 2C
MEEICCEVAAGLSDRKAECGGGEAGTARRRRMGIQRLGVVADKGPSKRRKLDRDEDDDGASWPAPTYGVMSVCGRRRDMEDAVSARSGFLDGHHFFGVFDGHGCSHVSAASFRSRQLLLHRRKQISWLPALLCLQLCCCFD